MNATKSFFYRPRGALKVEGPDAGTFLQGQFSNDLSKSEKDCIYGLWLDRKGKIVADSFILCLAKDQYFLMSYLCETSLIQKRLDKYIIMDEVNLTPCSQGVEAISLWGEGIDLAAEVLKIELPEANRISRIGNAIAFWGMRDRERVLEIVRLNPNNDDETFGRFCGKLEKIRCPQLDETEVARLAVQESMPLPSRDILNTDLPQEAELDEVAVSFQKGCYLGQEVMARIQSMGRTRRGLKGSKWDVDLSNEIYPLALFDEDGAKCGELRQTAFDGCASWGFAMVKATSLSLKVFVDMENGNRVGGTLL